ncbi:MAG: hypothetical protein Q8O05_06395 [Chloroflexota bacterium]|nr:hypothetical protein [Chloroflexota bacterium]
MIKREDKIEIDLETGKISFGGVFRGLGSLIGLVSRLNDAAAPEPGEVPAEIMADFDFLERVDACRRQQVKS